VESCFRGTQGAALEHYLSYSDFSFNSVEYVAIDRAGYAYISGGSSILKTAPGQQGQALQLTNPVHGLSVDWNDHLFVGTSSAVYKFNQSGVRELFAGSVPRHTDGPRLNSGFDPSPSQYRPEYQPRSLTFGTDGSLFVADGDAVRRISTNGVVSTLQDSRSSIPGFTVDAIVGIAAHSNGDIYAIANRQIKRISRDSDRDGISDADEIPPFNVGVDDSAVDTDADGSDNAIEYLAGTNAGDSASFPHLLALNTQAGLQLSWSGTASRGEILLERSANLTNWVSITNSIYSGSTTVPFSGTRSFLRARIQ
jgi:hypothetical protein